MPRYIIETQKEFERPDGWIGSVQIAKYTIETSCIRAAISEAMRVHECERIDTKSYKVLESVQSPKGLWAFVTGYGAHDPAYVGRPSFHIVAAKEIS